MPTEKEKECAELISQALKDCNCDATFTISLKDTPQAKLIDENIYNYFVGISNVTLGVKEKT
jgi:hypothetical protein